MRNNKNTFYAGKLGEPSYAEGSGIFGDVAMAVGDLAITKGIPYLAKKSVEAGRYYASEAMRDPKLQKKAINYTLDKARPAIQKVGSEMLDQLSTKVRPNQRYKTDRPDLDGAGFDIHAAIGKFPGHNFTGPYNPLEKQVKYDPETGEILEIYQVQQMRLLCNMMLIMMFVPTVKKIR